MAHTTSSAEPDKLIRYADVATRMDQDLLTASNALRYTLQRFERTCREYPVYVSSFLADAIGAHAQHALEIDGGVRDVGIGFLETGRALVTRQALFSFLKHSLSLAVDFAGGRGDFKDRLRLLGLFLNWVTDQRGHVKEAYGFYDFLAKQIPYRGSLDGILRRPRAQWGFEGLGLVLDYLEDTSKGKYEGDRTKIIGVNVANVLVQLAIGATGVGGAVLLANTIVQIVGNGQVFCLHGVAEGLGWLGADEELKGLLVGDARRVAGAVEQTDVDNVTKELSETAYDVYAALSMKTLPAVWQGIQEIARQPSWEALVRANRTINETMRQNAPTMPGWAPSPVGWPVFLACPGVFPVAPLFLSREGREGLGDVGIAAVNVLDGVVDWAVLTLGSAASVQVAALSVGLCHLLDGPSEKAVNDTAKAMIRTIQKGTHGLADWVDLDTTSQGGYNHAG